MIVRFILSFGKDRIVSLVNEKIIVWYISCFDECVQHVPDRAEIRVILRNGVLVTHQAIVRKPLFVEAVHLARVERITVHFTNFLEQFCRSAVRIKSSAVLVHEVCI